MAADCCMPALNGWTRPQLRALKQLGRWSTEKQTDIITALSPLPLRGAGLDKASSYSAGNFTVQ